MSKIQPPKGYKPENVKRCYYCGAKVIMARGERTIFHKPGCKPAETKIKGTGKSEAELRYPKISHGGYVSGDIFGI